MKTVTLKIEIFNARQLISFTINGTNYQNNPDLANTGFTLKVDEFSLSGDPILYIKTSGFIGNAMVVEVDINKGKSDEIHHRFLSEYKTVEAEIVKRIVSGTTPRRRSMVISSNGLKVKRQK